jgi:PAS domain S-box-containing protein
MGETAEHPGPVPNDSSPSDAFRRGGLDALLNASRVLASSLDVTQSLQAIAAQAAAVSGIPTVRLFLLDEATQLLRCGIGVGLPLEDEQDFAVPIGEGLSGHVAATRLPLAVSDMRRDPRLRHPEHAQRHGRVSFLGLPVVHRDRLFGVLVFNTPEPREYRAGEIALLTAFAQLAAAALHHAHVHEAIRFELGERRQAEAALRRQETQYRSLAENLPDTIARFDLALRYIYVNQQMEAELGIPAAAVLGKTNRELGFPEAVVSPLEDTLRDVLRDGQSRAVEYSLPTPHGVREYEARVVPERGPDGTVETFLVIKRNITERKESERTLGERTRQLEAVRAISVEITRELDLGRLLALIVQRAVELVGGDAGAVMLWDDRTQSLVPRAWHGCGEWMADIRLRPGEDLAGAVAAQRRGMLANDYAASAYASPTVLEHASVVAALAEPLVYQDRLPGVVVLYHVEPGRTFTGQHQELLALLAAQAAIAIENARLFTEARQSYRELQRAQEQLVQTEKLRALGQMSAGMAHDLNNVLAAVLGQAELLQAHVANPDARGSLRTLEMAARDGAHIIRRLQDFSRQKPGQPSVPVVLAAVVSEALKITRPRWKDAPEHRGVGIEIRTAVEHLPPVLGDDAEIREVLTNLILNAVDAMPGGGSIEITGRVVESDGGREERQSWVEVYVTDTGTGMAEEVRRRIFDPFFTTKGVHGSGLGLSVVYGIMERHGGHIGVASVPGQGSIFTLRFQIAQGDGGRAPSGAKPPIPVCRRILLVDDEPHVRETIAELLRSAGHTVIEAEGAVVGLTRLAESPVDLVLTDLRMPDMNGIEFARTIKRQTPTLPVVLLTGWGNRSIGQETVHGVVDAVLGKPVGLEELLNCVDACVRRAEPPGPA